jgi:hypothetical protein
MSASSTSACHSPRRHRPESRSPTWRHEQLSKHVESRAFRASQAQGRLLTRAAAAETWFCEEYEPVADALDELGIGGSGTETTRCLRVALLRDLQLDRRQRGQPERRDRHRQRDHVCAAIA